MARQKNQLLMFNDTELALLKAVFGGDGEEYLYLIRKALLQFPLTKEEKKILRSVLTAEVYAVVKKKILPSLDPDAPFGQLGDLNQSLANDLRSKSVDDMAPLFEAKRLEIAYLTQQFEYLMDVEQDFVPEIVLEDWATIEEGMANGLNNYVHTTARNFILGYVDAFLIQLKSLAGEKTETPEEQKKRLQRDSSE